MGGPYTLGWFLKIFDPQVKIFKKLPRAVEVSASLKIIGTLKINIKEFKTSGDFFYPFWPLGGSESKILSKFGVPKRPSVVEISADLMGFWGSAFF